MRSTVLLFTALLTASACSQTTTAQRSDQPAGPDATGSTEIYRVAEDVLRDPAKRFDLMNQLARSIFNKTRKVDDARYQNVVRPNVFAQLRAAGFSNEDAESILERSDGHHPTMAKNPGGGGPSRAP